MDKIESTKTIYTKDGTSLSKEEVSTKFDLDNVKCIQDNLYLLDSKSDIDNAKNDILLVNEIITEAHNSCNHIPNIKITTNDLHFRERKINGTNAFNFLIFAPLTKTGKTPKHPVILYFYINQNLFGELYYNQQGNVDKRTITLWNKSNCYELSIKNIKNKLSLNAIYQHDTSNGKKIKL